MTADDSSLGPALYVSAWSGPRRVSAYTLDLVSVESHDLMDSSVS
jgi:hypothetical protein